MMFLAVLMLGKMWTELKHVVLSARMIQHFSCKYRLEALMNLPQLSTGVVNVANSGMISRFISGLYALIFKS